MATMKFNISSKNQVISYSMFGAILMRYETPTFMKKWADGGISKIIFFDIFNYQYF